MSPLFARFSALPRAARWSILTAAVIVLYFAVIEPVLDATNSLRNRADATAAALARERDLRTAAAPASAAAVLGSPALPAPAPQAKQALYKRIEAVFAEHRLNPDIIERTSPLRAPQADSLTAYDERLDRLILDLSFEAAPETVTSIIAQLEQAPEIAAISRLQLRRIEPARATTPAPSGRAAQAQPAPAPRLRATIAAEAWVKTRTGSRQ